MSRNPEPRPSPRPLNWPAAIYRLQEILGTDAARVFMVGGVVRDAFWGHPIHDVDLAVASNAFQVARKIADALNGAFYKLDPERETGRAIVQIDGQRVIIDVARFRGNHLGDDLAGRDFTLNAVASPLQGDLDTVIDPLDGLQDAQRRILRRCSPESIKNDPIRALRAVRMSTRFKLRIEPETLADIRSDGPRIVSMSPERIRDEFLALLSGRQPAAALRALDTLGLLNLIVPELDALRDVQQSAPHQFDVWDHTLKTVDRLDGVLQTINPRRTDNTAAQAGLGMIVYYLDRYRGQLQEHMRHLWPNEREHRGLLILAALLHDIGKPATLQHDGARIRFYNHEIVGAELAEERAEGLALSRHEITRLTRIIRHHLRPHLLNQAGKISRRAVYRYWRDCADAGTDVCLLSLADYLATVDTTLSTEAWGQYLQAIDVLLDGHYGESPNNVTALPALITGTDLIRACHLKSGPQVGELLEQIKEAQAAGEVNDRVQAIALARQLIQAKRPLR